MRKTLRFHHVVGGLAMILFIAGAFFPDRLRALAKPQKLPFVVERIIRLGDVPSGKTTSREVSLLNPHLQTVKLREVSTSCGCTAAKSSVDSILPLWRGTISISVTPSSKGKGEEEISLETSRGSQQISVEFNAV